MSEDLREKVARVIDPEAYDEVTAEDNDDGAAIFADAWEDALTKADAILNLIGGDGWKPIADGSEGRADPAFWPP